MHVIPIAPLSRWLLLALLSAPALAWAQAGSVPSQPHLLVKGQAERGVKPDRITIDLLLQETDMQPEAARARVQQNASHVLEAMKDSRVIADTVNASTLSITSAREFVEGRQEFRGTRVSRTIRGTFGSVGDVRRFLGQLRASEQLQVSSLRSGYADAGALRARLKAEAAEQTRRSAAGLARAYGTRIKGLYTISDVAPSFAYGVKAGTWPAANGDADTYQEGAPAAPPAPVADIGAVVVSGSRIDPELLESGTLAFSENVYAIFLIE